MHFLKRFIYFEKDRDNVSGGGVEREGDRESQAGSMLPAVEPDVGLKLMNYEIMTEPKPRIRCLTN